MLDDNGNIKLAVIIEISGGYRNRKSGRCRIACGRSLERAVPVTYENGDRAAVPIDDCQILYAISVKVPNGNRLRRAPRSDICSRHGDAGADLRNLKKLHIGAAAAW